MDQLSQHMFKYKLAQNVASDLASKNPELIKRAQTVKAQFLQDKQNNLLTGDGIDFAKYLTAYSNNSGPKSFLEEFNKPFAAARASLAKKAPATKKVLSYGDEDFVGPPTLANLESNPNLDYLTNKYTDNMVKNANFAKIRDNTQMLNSSITYNASKLNLATVTKLKSTIKTFYEKSLNGYTPELADEFKKISNTATNMGFDNVSDVKMATNHFQKMIQNSALKKYNTSPVQFIEEHQRYLKLSNEEKLKSPFRKKLVDLGMMYSRGIPGTLMYTEESAKTFSFIFDQDRNFLTNPDNATPIASMALLGENILGKIYNDKQKFNLSQIKPLETKMEDINNQIQTIQAKYTTKIQGLDNELKKINSTEPKTQEEYNLMSSRFSAIQNQIKSIELQAKTETSSLYKQHRDIYKQYKPKISELANDGDAFNKQLSLSLNDSDYSMKFKDAYSKQQVQDSYLNKAAKLTGFLTPVSEDVARIGINLGKWVHNDIAGATSNWAISKFDKGYGSYKASVEKLDVERQQYSWNTGEIDGEGNPVTTKTVRWKDADGNSHINPTGAAEAIAQTTAQMALSILVTKGLAAGTAGVANAAGNIGVKAFNGLYGTAKYSKFALTGADVLKTSIGGINVGSRLMTYPAVYMTTYGKSLNEAVNNFDTYDKAKEHAGAMTNFEALTESIVPDVFFFSNKLWSPKLAAKLGEKQLKEITSFLSTLKNVEGKAAKKLFANKVLATVGEQGLNTIQEALVEEEINYALQSSYETNKIKELGVENYVRQGEEFTAKGAVDLGIESLITMSASSLLGLKGSWQNVSQKMGFDPNNPKYMNYHRMNVAANANQVRTSIANDNTINAEQKARAFQTISQYEELLKTAAMAVKKPNAKTLANDDDGVFAYFTALSDKMDIETKMLKGTISEEETKKYEVTSKILESIDKENKDWNELDPQQKQDKWFKWYKEHSLNVDAMGLKNSSSNQLLKLEAKQEEVEKLYKDNHINDEMYAKYKQSFDETHKDIKGKARKNVEANLENIENLSLHQLDTLSHDIRLTMALNNDSKVSSHTYSTNLLPEEGELSGRPQDFKNRIAESMEEIDKVKVEYLDKDDNSKQATLVKRNGELYIEGTELQLDEVDEIQKATIGVAQLSANKDYEQNKSFYESALQKVKTARMVEFAKFQDRFGKEIQAINETSEKEKATIVETTNKNGKTIFQYKTFDPKTNAETVLNADTREAAEKKIELKKKIALSQLYSKRDDVLPKTDTAVEANPVVQPQAPVAPTPAQPSSTPTQPATTPVTVTPQAIVVTAPAVETPVAEEDTSGQTNIEKLIFSKETDTMKRKQLKAEYIDNVKDIEAEIDQIIEFKTQNELNAGQKAIVDNIIASLRAKQQEEKSAEKTETPKTYQEVKADIDNRIVITGTNGGHITIDSSNSKNANSGTSADLRMRDSDDKYTIEYGEGDDRKSLFKDIKYNDGNSYHYYATDKKTGKKYYIVGISNRVVSSNDSDRYGSLYATIEDDGNLPSNIRTLLELSLIKQFDIQSQKSKTVFENLPKSFIDKVNAKNEQEKTSFNKEAKTETKTIDGLIADIKKLRADEQAEYAAMSDPNDQVKRKEIYDRYNGPITDSLRKAKADIEARRKADLESVKNWRTKILAAKNKEELQKAAKEIADRDPYSQKDTDVGIIAALTSPGAFERGKELLVKDLESIEKFFTKSEIDNIKAKYDAELEALKPETQTATIDIEAQKADIDNRVVISANADGMRALDAKNESKENGGRFLDIRGVTTDSEYEVTFEDEDSKKGFFKDMSSHGNKSYAFRVKVKKTGNVYYYVAVTNTKDFVHHQRNGTLIVNVKDDGKLPSAIRTILELKLIEASKKYPEITSGFKELPKEFIDSVNAKYDALKNNTAQQENLREEDQQVPVEDDATFMDIDFLFGEKNDTEKEVVVDETVKPKYSDERVVTTPFSTVADERNKYEGEYVMSTDKYTIPIHKFLKSIGDAISSYKGKLMSTTKIFESQGVNIQEVKDKLAEYWALSEEDKIKNIDEYSQFLDSKLGGMMPSTAIQWLLKDGVTTDVLYNNGKEVAAKDKFEKITLSTFSLVLTDNNGSILKVDDKGKVSPNGTILVRRSLNKIVKDPETGKYKFANIKSTNSPAFNAMIPVMYDIQDKFINGELQELEVENLGVTNGAYDSTSEKKAPKGDLTLQIEDDSAIKREAGRMYDEDGNIVYTEEMSEADLDIVAAMLTTTGITKEKYKEYNAYVNAMVYIRDEDKNRFRKMSPENVKKELKSKHYNISDKLLGGAIQQYKLENGVLTPTAKMPYDKFMEDKWYTRTFDITPGINNKITFTPKTSTEEEVVKDSLADLGVDLEGIWEYSKSNGKKRTTSEQDVKAYMWFMKSFLSKGIELNKEFIAHPTAFASFTNSAYTLYEGSNFTDLYHEAWHRFSQNFLTIDEKENLYNAFKSMFEEGEVTDAELKVLEESLAEGSRSYAMSGYKTMEVVFKGKTLKINMEKPAAKQKTFVEKIKSFFNMFKSMFTTKQGTRKSAEDVVSDYMREAHAESTLRTSDPKNALFQEALNTSRTRTFNVTDDKGTYEVTFDYASMHELNQGIDYLFINYFNNIPQYKEAGIKLSAIASLPENLRNEVVGKIYAKIKKDLQDAGSMQTNEVKKREFKAIVDNFDILIREGSELRNAFVNSYKNVLDAELKDLNEDESKINTAELYENKIDQQGFASNAVLDAVKFVPKLNKDGSLYNGSTWGLPELTPFANTWVILANNLQGMTYPEMHDKITEMANSTHPQFKYLLENLPAKELAPNARLTTHQLKVDFEQVFSMPKVAEVIVQMSTDQANNFIVKVFEAGTSANKNIIEGWKSEVSDPVSLKEVFEKYPTTASLGTTDEVINFLKDVGITFSDENAVMQQFENKNKLADFRQAALLIHKHLLEVSKTTDIADNIISTIQNDKNNGRKGEGKQLAVLAKFEIATNEEISDDMIYKANGSTDFKFKQFNYLTKLSFSMDRMPYEELAKEYPQFDLDKNPAIRNSNWFNHLFSIDANGKVSRTKANSLEFIRMGGLESDELNDREGFVTVDLLASDKLVMDFYSFTQSGLEENSRNGDKTTAYGSKLNGVSAIAVTDTKTMLDNLQNLLLGELANLKHLQAIQKTNAFPTSSKQHLHKDETLVFFKNMLSEELKTKLLATTIELRNNKWQFKDETLTSEIHKELMDYFKSVAIDGKKGKPSFKTMLVSALGPRLDEVMPKIHTAETNKKETYTTDEILMWYYMQSVANRIDQFNVMFGDARNFGNGSDIFKRLSAYTATGKFPVLNQDDLNMLDVKGRELESLFSEGKRAVTSQFNIVQFKDLPVNLSEEYMGQDLPESLKKAWGDYIKESDGKNKGEKTDASGAVTLDFYRMLNKLIGTWTPAQEKAYDSQVAFVKAKIALQKTDPLTQGLLREAYDKALDDARATYEDLLTVFNPKKWQYAGSIFSSHTVASKMDMRAFLKFSIMPLIPSNIVNSELEKVSENMYKTGTDLYVFKSGSKMSIDQENQNFSSWSSDKTPTFNPTVLDLKNFKEQLPIENKMKNEGVFASQMRKLMSVGIFENGEVAEGRNTEYYDRYSKAVSNITDLLSVDLASKLDTPKKIVEYLSKEFDKRDMPEHIKEFMQHYEKEGAIVNSLDLSFQSFFIQNALFSIINSKLIKQEYSGGQFVQVPNVGFKKANFKQNAEYGQQDLLFYQTPVGGNTISMQIKIAFSKKYEGLLELEEIGKVANKQEAIRKLNSLLRDKAFMEKHGKKVTLVGCRIPVQGFSTIESMQVVEFLDPIAGQVIIVPDGLTIKSGSDFDIDKMNIYEPHIDRNGELINLGINETHNVIEERNKIVKENEEYKSLLDELKNQIKDIDKTDLDEWIAIDEAIAKAREEDEIDLTVLATDNKKGTKFTGFDQLAAAKKDNSKLKKALADKKVWQEKGKTLGENREELLDMINALKTNISANRRALATMVSSEINTLISSVSEMILDKDNATNLLTMNELDYVEGAYLSMGMKSKKESTMDISDVADPIVSNEVFGVNTDAKRMLGIAAKSNPLYAMFMQVGMKLNGKVASMLPQNTTPEGVTSLSNLYTQPYSGKNSEKYSKSGNMLEMYIPKLLSEYISMSVDVANDNRIGDPRLNINKFTMPMLIWNTMKGTHLFDTLDILTDPMVIQFTKQYRKKNSISYKQYVNKTSSQKEAREILSKNKFIRNTLKSIVPEDLRIGTISRSGEELINIEGTVNNALNNGVKHNLLEFINMMLNGNKLTELSSAVSWDTTTSNSFIEFAYTDRQLFKIEKDGFFNGANVNKLRYDSVIAGLNITDFVEDKFADLFSIISKDKFIDKALESFSKTTAVQLKDFARDYTTDFLTYLYQNNAKVLKNGQEVSAYDLHINQERLLDKTNEDNIKNRFYNAIAKVKNPAIKSNSFVSNLKFNTINGSNFMAPVIKNAKLDADSANTMHADMLKLISGAYSTDSTVNAELAEAAKELFKVTALYNGLIKTIGAFNSLIPTDDFTKTLKDVVANGITEEQYNKFNTLFAKNRKGKYFPYSSGPKASDKNNRYSYFIFDKNVVSSQEDGVPSSKDLGLDNLNLSQDDFKC